MKARGIEGMMRGMREREKKGGIEMVGLFLCRIEGGESVGEGTSRTHWHCQCLYRKEEVVFEGDTVLTPSWMVRVFKSISSGFI